MSGWTRLGEDHEELRAFVRGLAEQKIAPRAAAIDDADTFPWDMVTVLKDAGLYGFVADEEYGGFGFSTLKLCLIVEEIARVSASVAMLYEQVGGALPLHLAGSHEQKDTFLRRLASGAALSAYAMTEPGAGSDVQGVATRAVRDGDEYVVSGRKHFVTNGGVSTWYAVLCRTSREAPASKAFSVILVESDRPGFSVGRVERKMGLRGSQTGELIFDDVRVPVCNLIGEEGTGFGLTMKVLDHARTVAGAMALGIAQGAIGYAVEYSKDRCQFGVPIARLEALQLMAADALIGIEESRSLVYAAAEALDRGDPAGTPLSAAAKYTASDTAMRVTTDAVQMMGGYGYMKDYPVERGMRDAKIYQILGGTNQIQRLVVARQVAVAR
jgi:alkylation response protein AidB-like acyl-CoA dehydrogenase